MGLIETDIRRIVQRFKVYFAALQVRVWFRSSRLQPALPVLRDPHSGAGRRPTGPTLSAAGMLRNAKAWLYDGTALYIWRF